MRAILVVIFSLILTATPPINSHSSTGAPTFALLELAGVKKIFYTTRYKGEAVKEIGFLKSNFNDITQAALQSLFLHRDSKLIIKPLYQAQIEDHGYDVLIVNLVLTIRDDKKSSKSKPAAISFQLEREWADKTSKYPYRDVHVYPKTYPFIIPDNAGDFEKDVQEGISRLLGFLPSYLDCADKIVVSQSCMDKKSEFDDE